MNHSPFLWGARRSKPWHDSDFCLGNSHPRMEEWRFRKKRTTSRLHGVRCRRWAQLWEFNVWRQCPRKLVPWLSGQSRRAERERERERHSVCTVKRELKSQVPPLSHHFHLQCVYCPFQETRVQCRSRAYLQHAKKRVKQSSTHNQGILTITTHCKLCLCNAYDTYSLYL